MWRRLHFILTLLLLPALSEASESSDSINLDEIVVTGRSHEAATIPVQRLDGKELQRLGSHGVADALRYFSGVQIKDYGGVGGIKTVNVRSMGSHHTGVVYDGVQLGNAQNGQIDLGQFSLDNIEAISLYNGQKSNILQPARDFGNAGSIYMRTLRPRFTEGRNYRLRATFRTGAFDLVNPSLLVEKKLSDAVDASISAEWLKSSGRYKFRCRRLNADGETAYDTTAVRQNGDIDALRAEANVFGHFTEGLWSAKVYNYTSHRGIPGAIVNNVWRRGERLGDNNTFAQGSLTKYIGKFTTLANAKFAFYRTHYINNDASQLKVDNRYYQREIYLSTANMYSILPSLNVSASYDFAWNDLRTDMHGFQRPVRTSHLAALAAAFSNERFSAQASCLGTFIRDKVESREKAYSRHAFTPAVYTSVYPLDRKELSLRAFFKQSFRMPTFNDLYYTDMGNSSLKPERVTQYDIGAAYEHRAKNLPIFATISLDAYHNTVSNKIVAYPKGQQFRWTMLNLGRVHITGVDVAATLSYAIGSELQLTLRGQYTYQRAIDVTDPSDTYYRHQIPYVPHHSGSAILGADWKNWHLNFSYICVGERYNQPENIRYNYMSPWQTADISLSKDLQISRVRLRVLAEVNNLFSYDYAVILNYPMPKRNCRFTITIEI